MPAASVVKSTRIRKRGSVVTDQDPLYSGLSLEDILPFNWEPVDFSHSSILEHANEDTARALQAIAVYEEAPRSPTDDLVNYSGEGSRLEAKIDLMLSLISNLVGEHVGLPEPQPMIIRARTIEWQAEPSFVTERGSTGLATIWANAHIPLPLRLPCRIERDIERNGFKWIQSRFEFLAPNVSDGLDQVIFRHHRRQVAIARGTMVQSKTKLR